MSTKISEMTDQELKQRAISLESSIRQVSRYGDLDKVEELKAERDLIHQEREQRHLDNED